MGSKEWQDYYAILGLYDPIEDFGIGPEATQSQIKRAWEHQRRMSHPDNFRSGTREWRAANERFKLVDEANSVLSDAGKKERYDRDWRQRRGGGKKAQVVVTPQPANVLEKLYEGIPVGESREATLKVRAKVGSGFKVRIQEPLPSWLEVVPMSGIPPFDVRLRVLTRGLKPSEEKRADIVFLIEE